MTRQCTKCKRELPIERFSKLGDGYQLHCKECKAKYYQARKKEISEKRKREYRKLNPIEVLPSGMKRCSKCNEVKPVTEFGKLSKAKDGLRYHCKECRNKYYQKNQKYIIKRSKIYYEENKGRISEITKAYKEENKEWYREYHQKYYIENIEDIKERVKQNHYQRMEEDIGYKLLQRCRARLYKAIKENNKSASTRELIGCTTDKLKEHLESQFTEGMSWENYGEWHIDHIKPCSMFDFTKEEHQRECFNYTNLQPLWAKDNMKKSDKYEKAL